MWVSKNSDWSNVHTDLTKYFFEKVKQQVDYSEIISNKHRTTNGFSLIKEIVDACVLTLQRRKSFRRLETLMSEANDPDLKSNISKDYILNKFHNDIPFYYKTLKIRDDERLIKDVLYKSKIFFYRLEKQYLDNLIFEMKSFDFASTSFFENTQRLDAIISNLVPYLLFVGYSPTMISNVASRMIKKNNSRILPELFLRQFANKKRSYEFFIIADDQAEEFCHFKEYFSEKKINYSEIDVSTVDWTTINNQEKLFKVEHSCTDPHNFIRNLYERSIRKHVLEQPRTSLSFFNDYFDKVYWKIPNYGVPQQSVIKIDPIIVKGRTNTLKDTLLKVLNFSDKLPIIPDIKDSVYYYNLALGSKSIENSLMLMWAALESLVPYRFKNSDISNIQYFVSKSLGIGAVGRVIFSFATRLIASSEFNELDFKGLGIKPEINLTPDKFSYWPFWLGETNEAVADNNFAICKSISNLLGKQYQDLNNFFSGRDHAYKVGNVADKINGSKRSIEFQLDRIYMHRNQVVHSGKFINEYSNLWLHLEWYIGKLLSYCFIKYLSEDRPFSKEKVFMELEGDHDLILNLIDNYRGNTIREINFSYEKLFQHTWQFF